MEVNHTHLLECSAKNDIEAFKQLYEDTYTILYRIAQRLVQKHDRVEAVLQDSYLKIWFKATTFDPTKNIALVWMCAITKNTALDFLCSEENHKKSSVIHDDATRKYLNSYQDLQLDQIKYLTCFNQNGFNHAEVAKKLNVPLVAVKHWIRNSPHLMNQLKQI